MQTITRSCNRRLICRLHLVPIPPIHSPGTEMKELERESMKQYGDLVKQMDQRLHLCPSPVWRNPKPRNHP